MYFWVVVIYFVSNQVPLLQVNLLYFWQSSEIIKKKSII